MFMAEHSSKEKEEPVKEANPSGWDKLLGLPEIGQAILHAIDTWQKSIEANAVTTNRAGKRFLVLAIVIFIIITGSVVLLTLVNKISSEATAFLLGVIVTGAIAIIRDFTGSSNRS